MAFNPEYAQASVLSKAKIGDVVYYIKDAEVRTNLDNLSKQLKGGAFVDVSTEVKASDSNLITSGAVDAAIKASAEKYTKALIFRGVSTTDPTLEGGPTINDEKYQGVEGDVILFNTKEFIYANGKWNELGDEGLYLTKAEAEEKYVKKTTEIAGIAINAGITAEALKTALGLKKLAYQDKVIVSTNDYVTGVNPITAGKAGTYDLTGDAVTAVTGLTPVTAVTGGTVSVDKVTVANTPASVSKVATEGKFPVYDSGTYTKPSVNEATSGFATAGVTARVGSEADAETLIFEVATIGQALTTTNFNAGAVEFPKITEAGAMPTFSEVSVIGSIGEASATASFKPETAQVASATAQGTAQVAPSTAQVTITSEEVTPTLITGNKDFTVGYGVDAQ